MKKRFLIGLLVIIFIFEVISVSCKNNSKKKEAEIWLNVTDFSELEGTWKILSNVVFPEREDSAGTWFIEIKDYILTFNTIDNILISSSNRTEIYTGENVNIWEMWKQLWKEQWEEMDQNGYTLIIDESNHSMNTVIDNHTQILSEEVIVEIMSYIQINQERNKIKETVEGIEIILHNATTL